LTSKHSRNALEAYTEDFVLSTLKTSSAFILILTVILFQSCGDKELQDRMEEAVDEAELFDNPETNRSRFNGIVKTSDGRQLYEVQNGKAKGSTVGLDDQNRKIFEGELQEGKAEGFWTTFHDNGSPRWRGQKKDGKNNGPFTMWYPDGKKKMAGIFLNGEKDGLSTVWHPNGVKWREQRHEKGIPNGIWRSWDSEGTLLEEINYIEGLQMDPPPKIK
jgi:antitoxin component YwqK of YwqJK toxin-antitoxin module